MAESLLEVTVSARRRETDRIVVLTLRAVDGGPLPACAPGAHIDLHLAPGMVRSYSLLQPQGHDAYEIAVQREVAGRGGSAHVHEHLVVGRRLEVGAPRNHFPLNEEAGHTVFIAGGIGITPLLCMARRLQSLGRSWHMHCAARTRSHAAFLDELQSFGDRVSFAFDHEPGGRMLDLQAVVDAAPAAAELYACGPAPMLAAFLRAAAGRAAATVHVEHFSPPADAPAPARAGGFDLVLARSGLSLRVAPGETVLDKLLAAGCDVPYSCMEGVCGSCETRVLEGTPDHRDSVLSEADRRSGNTMMVCCSGAHGDRLVLDV